MHHIAILLAAGKSTRMGRNKLLLDWQGQPLIRHVAQSLLLPPFAERLVVLGHQASEVLNALAGLPFRFVQNDSFGHGMAGSIAKGVCTAIPQTETFLIVLGDMPNLSPDLIQAVHTQAGRDRIVVPRFENREGNPVCFGADFRSELEALAGDKGARSVIEAHRDQVVYVDWPEDSAFADLDCPEDLAP